MQIAKTQEMTGFMGVSFKFELLITLILYDCTDFYNRKSA